MDREWNDSRPIYLQLRDGVVEMMLDATTNYTEPLTADRLFGWHAALFPTGRSGLHKITVGNWRNDTGGPMQVVMRLWTANSALVDTG